MANGDMPTGGMPKIVIETDLDTGPAQRKLTQLSNDVQKVVREAGRAARRPASTPATTGALGPSEIASLERAAKTRERLASTSERLATAAARSASVAERAAPGAVTPGELAQAKQRAQALNAIAARARADAAEAQKLHVQAVSAYDAVRQANVARFSKLNELTDRSRKARAARQAAPAPSQAQTADAVVEAAVAQSPRIAQATAAIEAQRAEVHKLAVAFAEATAAQERLLHGKSGGLASLNAAESDTRLSRNSLRDAKQLLAIQESYLTKVKTADEAYASNKFVAAQKGFAAKQQELAALENESRTGRLSPEKGARAMALVKELQTNSAMVEDADKKAKAAALARDKAHAKAEESLANQMANHEIAVERRKNAELENGLKRRTAERRKALNQQARDEVAIAKKYSSDAAILGNASLAVRGLNYAIGSNPLMARSQRALHGLSGISAMIEAAGGLGGISSGLAAQISNSRFGSGALGSLASGLAGRIANGAGGGGLLGGLLGGGGGGGAAAGLAAAGGIAAITAAVVAGKAAWDKYVRAVEKAETISRVMGVSIREGQAWSHVFDQWGISAEVAGRQMRRFAAVLQQGRFEPVRRDIARTATGAIDLAKSFANIADHYKQIQGAAERTNFVRRAFGVDLSEGAEGILRFQRLLESGGADMSKRFEEALKKTSLGSQDVKNLQDMKRDWAEISHSLESAAIKIVQAAMPLVKAVSSLAGVVASFYSNQIKGATETLQRGANFLTGGGTATNDQRAYNDYKANQKKLAEAAKAGQAFAGDFSPRMVEAAANKGMLSDAAIAYLVSSKEIDSKKWMDKQNESIRNLVLDRAEAMGLRPHDFSVVTDALDVLNKKAEMTRKTVKELFFELSNPTLSAQDINDYTQQLMTNISAQKDAYDRTHQYVSPETAAQLSALGVPLASQSSRAASKTLTQYNPAEYRKMLASDAVDKAKADRAFEVSQYGGQDRQIAIDRQLQGMQRERRDRDLKLQTASALRGISTAEKELSRNREDHYRLIDAQASAERNLTKTRMEQSYVDKDLAAQERAVARERRDLGDALKFAQSDADRAVARASEDLDRAKTEDRRFQQFALLDVTREQVRANEDLVDAQKKLTEVNTGTAESWKKAAEEAQAYRDALDAVGNLNKGNITAAERERRLAALERGGSTASTDPNALRDARRAVEDATLRLRQANFAVTDTATNRSTARGVEDATTSLRGAKNSQADVAGTLLDKTLSLQKAEDQLAYDRKNKHAEAAQTIADAEYGVLQARRALEDDKSKVLDLEDAVTRARNSYADSIQQVTMNRLEDEKTAIANAQADAARMKARQDSFDAYKKDMAQKLIEFDAAARDVSDLAEILLTGVVSEETLKKRGKTLTDFYNENLAQLEAVNAARPIELAVAFKAANPEEQPFLDAVVKSAGKTTVAKTKLADALQAKRDWFNNPSNPDSPYYNPANPPSASRVAAREFGGPLAAGQPSWVNERRTEYAIDHAGNWAAIPGGPHIRSFDRNVTILPNAEALGRAIGSNVSLMRPSIGQLVVQTGARSVEGAVSIVQGIASALTGV